MVLFCGCFGQKEPNPDIRYLLDMAKADSRYDDLYRQFRENVKTPNVSILKRRNRSGSLEEYGTLEYNPLVPDVTTFWSILIVTVEGSEWSYEADFFFTETNSIVAVRYRQRFRMPEPEIKPIDWHMKWEESVAESVTNIVEGEKRNE